MKERSREKREREKREKEREARERKREGEKYRAVKSNKRQYFISVQTFKVNLRPERGETLAENFVADFFHLSRPTTEEYAATELLHYPFYCYYQTH